MAASANRRRACGPSLLLRAIARRATVSKSLLSGIGMANLLRSPRLNQTRATPNRPTSHASRDLVSFTSYVNELRLQKALILLTEARDGARRISNVAFQVGFSDVSHFN